MNQTKSCLSLCIREELKFCSAVIDYEQSLFFLVRPAKRARHANDHACDWRRETGEALEGLFSCRPAARCLRAHALPCIKSEEKERLLAVYCSHEKAATTRQALKIPLSFLFDIFTFSTLRILTLAEFVCTGIKISKEKRKSSDDEASIEDPSVISIWYIYIFNTQDSHFSWICLHWNKNQ